MRMYSRSILRWAAGGMAAILLGLSGLSFGGGGATGTGYTAYGLLSDFGSIFVNGIEFFTTNASITINGVANRPESDLRIGMVLTVTGSVDNNGKTGNAATVVYNADALGALDADPVQDSTGGSFSVLGQSVTTTAQTVFAGVIGLSELHQGDIVEVSAFHGPNGLLASRIERLGSIPSVQVQGTIASVSGTTFTVGSLTVDDSGATLKNVPGGGLAAGQNVVVKGPAPVQGVLAATSVEVVVLSSGNTNGSSSGVLDAASSTSITLNGLTLVVTPSTQYVNGSAADLAAGKSVKVDYAPSSGKPTATKIEFVTFNSPSFVEADVTAISPNSVELLGPNGMLVVANSSTQFRDNSSARLSNFTLANVNVGDHLQVAGGQVNEDTILATRVVRRPPSATIEVDGRALSVAAPTFTVLDVPILVTADTVIRDANGNPVPANTFFATAAGHKANVAAAKSASGLVATSILLDY